MKIEDLCVPFIKYYLFFSLFVQEYINLNQGKFGLKKLVQVSAKVGSDGKVFWVGFTGWSTVTTSS